ncbi:hypothetical protein [Streptomyces sp. SAJ15]|uniref:hypothetical protein n=1 Tax=Streptomyces sp. SAJ15 TaxID=2011095 RepID=UPI0011847139|nr:hypothetical protein [Streptomyces sp. SAJ15]
MILRKLVPAAALGAALISGFAVPAQAATTADHIQKSSSCATSQAARAAAAEKISEAKTPSPTGCQPGPRWHYIDEYFWASDCAEAGSNGIESGHWRSFRCTCGGAFSDYQLWVR